MVSWWRRLREDFAVVFERDPAAKSRLEVFFCYPGLHALWGHRLAHGLWRRGLRFVARLVSHTMRFLSGVEIHPGARIGRRVFIDHGAGVVIGETAEIGDDCVLYQGVTLGGVSLEKGKRHPTIEDHVVLGAGAKVLGPITIRHGARVGANSVVIADVPAGATVVGIPAREVRRRDPAEAERITLHHERISDPVAMALGDIVARLEALERERRSGADPREEST
ncbi:MAG: serine O-acetyltransferase [Acidobacteriota bacterium]|nr:MAG: serine O-acetyltransferase [Acidobacteriota bacterium]